MRSEECDLLPEPAAGVHFFPWSQGGVLFLEGGRRLWPLNQTAAVVWCLLDGAASPATLARSVADRFRIPLDQALADVRAVVELFGQEGLLAGGKQEAAAGSESEPATLPIGSPVPEPAGWLLRRRYRIGGLDIEFCSQAEAACGAWLATMHHLAIDKSCEPGMRLWLLASEDHTWDICLDGCLVSANLPAAAVTPTLIYLTFTSVCAALSDRLLFHAAVLEQAGRALLFPAEAGSGKTTLAATAACHGFGYLSDELAVLDVDQGLVSPLPLPMSIKTGSLELVAACYPELHLAPEHLRADGKMVRYLAPPPGSIVPATARLPIGAILFPHYVAGAACSLRALEKTEALQRLVRTGSSDRPLRPADIAMMIRIVDEHPCYSLEYSSFPEVWSTLAGVVPG